MTCDGEASWYLSVEYTREPSGAVSASQELFINKILKRWGMEYNPANLFPSHFRPNPILCFKNFSSPSS